MRIDQFLVSKNFVESREKAKRLIKEGKIKINDKICLKPSYQVKPEDKIEIKENLKFVSRGGEKLLFALKEFNISPLNKICLDIGASTGGFVDCLIKNGAKKVYAIDIGTNQLHPCLRNNRRVVSLEKTDIRKFEANKKFDLITVDLSFISLKLVLKKIKNLLSQKGDLILLFKPQFEVGKKYIKKGRVKDKEIITKALKEFLEFSKNLGFQIIKVLPSPILGKKGNQEFFIYLKLLD
jgi:23S rRNA (cytidine1920-2'-O)/16S rRNA (cytidine1409-2'-O)-methyltransferase